MKSEIIKYLYYTQIVLHDIVEKLGLFSLLKIQYEQILSKNRNLCTDKLKLN